MPTTSKTSRSATQPEPDRVGILLRRCPWSSRPPPDVVEDLVKLADEVTSVLPWGPKKTEDEGREDVVRKLVVRYGVSNTVVYYLRRARHFFGVRLWKNYLTMIKERAKNAINVLDRFHIMSHMSKAIDKVSMLCSAVREARVQASPRARASTPEPNSS